MVGWRRRVVLSLCATGATIASLVVIAPSSQAATTSLYVDKTVACSDTGSGTATTPYCTIAKGVSQLQAGSTLYIGNGSYAETIKPAVSGTSSSPVTITGWPGRSPKIGSGVSYGAYISSRSYVVLSNLTFFSTVADGIYVSGSSNITISGNNVTDAGHPVSGQLAPGISLRSTNNSTVSGNTSDHNSDHGILLTSGSTGNTVVGNEASFNANGYRRNANGIDVISPGNTILRNVTHDNEDSGIQFYPGGNNNLATLNVTYNNGDHGIDDLNVTGGRLIGNTVYHNCTTGINVEGTSGSYTIANNVAVDNAVYPAYNGIKCSRRAGNIGIWDSAPASTTVNHNLVYLTTSGTMYVFKSSYTSLAAMQAATGQEKDGIQGNPKFANAGGANLQLTEGSPAIDRGDSGVSGEQDRDILGNPRVRDANVDNSHAAGPRLYDDLGAYEFQPGNTPPPPPSKPTAALSVSPASGTAPVQVTADASGSTDPQGQTLSYAFAWGDGATTPTQSTATATHTYTTAGSYTVTVTVTDTSGLSSTATRTVTVGSATTSPPAYVSQIATNYSTSSKTSGSITVWRTGGVKAGDLIVVTLQLAGTSSTGAVTATDDVGDQFTTASSVANASGDRLVVLSAVAGQDLAVNAKITATFPTATLGYRMIGDEFSGVTRVDQTASATGTAGTFSSGATPTTSAPQEVAFAAVDVTSGTGNPAWGSGWKDNGSYAVGSRYLGRAYQLTSSTTGVTGSGTASGPWLATAVTFQP